MSRAVLLDTNAFEDETLSILCEIESIKKLVVLKSVVREFVGFRVHPDPKKQDLSQRAAFTLLELQSMPGIKVIMDNQDPTDPHPDFDLLNRAKAMKGCILTADSELHEKAKARGIATLFLPEIRCRFRLITPTLVKLFPPLREIARGEILNVYISKAGRDGQGVAYLPAPDRRKIFINGGALYVHQTIAVRVDYIYQQTPKHQVIFAVPAVITAAA